MRRLTLSFVAGLALAGFAAAQIGGPLPPAEIDGFAQTPAKSLDDFLGRVVLVEFFAYW